MKTIYARLCKCDDGLALQRRTELAEILGLRKPVGDRTMFGWLKARTQFHHCPWSGWSNGSAPRC